MQKEKIFLENEMETLLVPLFSKAHEMSNRFPIIIDKKAEEILGRIEYNFADLKIPRQTLITLAMRAKQLDYYANEYIKNHDNPIVIHLGCGFDSRYFRIDSKNAIWYDIDFPNVIELRKHFYNENDNYHMIGSSVTDKSWVEKISKKGPACVIAEGLFMYLDEKEIKELFGLIKVNFNDSDIFFDAYGKLTAKGANSHPSIKKTGARIKWGIDNPLEIEKWNDNNKMICEWYFTDSDDIANLRRRDRALFRIMGMFKAAKQAHRILGYHI